MVVILWILWLCKQGELAVLSPALLLRAQPVQRCGVAKREHRETPLPFSPVCLRYSSCREQGACHGVDL